MRQRWDAGLEHLRALAFLLPTQRVVLPLSTVARGALEALGSAYYLGHPGIAAQERVRRSVNARLHSGREVSLLLAASSDRDRHSEADRHAAQEARDAHEAKMRGIVEAARRHGFAVRNEKDRYRPTHLGEKPPSTTSLCRAVVSETPGLGEGYYRNLSAVAHSTGHGLSQHVQVLAPLLDTTTGDAEGLVSMTANDAALRLFGAPLAAVTVVSEVFPICGWRVPDVEVKQMLFVWGRFAHVPHPDDPAR